MHSIHIDGLHDLCLLLTWQIYCSFEHPGLWKKTSMLGLGLCKTENKVPLLLVVL
jgi:hypothetical protein